MEPQRWVVVVRWGLVEAVADKPKVQYGWMS